MTQYLAGKVVYVVGAGSDEHRGVAVALADAGADVAVGGTRGDLAAEARLHSIANEIWAIGRKSTVAVFERGDPVAFARALGSVIEELGRADLVVRCEAIADV